MTRGEWLAMASARLAGRGLVSAPSDSRLILAHTLRTPDAALYANPQVPLPSAGRRRADRLLARRWTFEPMAYLLGHKEFYGLDFLTDRRALIPRGESEVVVEQALAILRTVKTKNLLVAEVGTGSGAIVCALAKNAPGLRYIATDIARGALALACKNATRMGVSIEFYYGSLLRPLYAFGPKIGLLVANLPYIPSPLLETLDPTIRYFEPNRALDGGPDGLVIYRRFFAQTPRVMAAGGTIIVEHDHDQALELARIIKGAYPKAAIGVCPDGAGHDRVTVVSV